MIRPTGIVSMVSLAMRSTGPGAPIESCKPAPPPSHTGAEAAGIAILAGVAIGTGILVEMHHDNHTVRGCVSFGPNGPRVLNDGDKKTYNLVGVTANTRVGDRVKLYGLKEKKKKDSAADLSFVVESISKDYGACPAVPAPS
jgi:hypothetical protein